MAEATWKLPPIEGKAYCGCGCGSRHSHAAMTDYTHPGFGCVYLTRDGESVEPWQAEDEFSCGVEDKTFQDYETVAAADPDHDWRLFINGPLSDYTYQRQGEGVWALVEQGQGFA